MSNEISQNSPPPAAAQSPHANLERRDDVRFQHDIEGLIKDSENMRLMFMKKQRSRNFLSVTLTVISILVGAAGFGWFFLMEGNLFLGLACMLAGMILPVLLNYWASLPIKAYSKHYKTDFMPKMANLLGGLQFHPARGISRKIITKTGVIMPHDEYNAEDCFMGIYKNVKVILSEARLYKKQKNKTETVFDGIFALLEIPEKIIEGHTILTADGELARKAGPTIWQKFKPVPAQTENPAWNKFQIFSTKPEAAELLVGEKFLKELSEAAEVFNNSPLSAVLFAGKFIFIAIPYEEDMFEASNMFVPVTTKKHAMQCKREIEQILEIIDLFELYKTQKTT